MSQQSNFSKKGHIPVIHFCDQILKEEFVQVRLKLTISLRSWTRKTAFVFHEIVFLENGENKGEIFNFEDLDVSAEVKALRFDTV